jgi:putative phosphoesterase
MTLLIVSDSHGRVDRLARLFELHKRVDALIFLGDGLSDLDRAEVKNYPFTVFSVKGNCDSGMGSLNALKAKDEITFNFEGVSFYALHVHTKGVKSSLVNAMYAAEEKGADVLLFGHTHEPIDTYITDGEYNLSKPLHIFNPGSLANYSYGLCEIRNGEFLFSHGDIY